MFEGDAAGMEGLAREAATRRLNSRVCEVPPLTAGVERVADDGVADVGHVDADLMGSAGDRVATHHRDSGKLLFDLVAGACGPAFA